MDWITTIVSIPAILAAVNIMKHYGLPSNWAPVISVVVGAVMAVVASYIQMQTFENLPAALMIGIVTGLSASGVYDVTKPELPAEPPETVSIPEQPGIFGDGAY